VVALYHEGIAVRRQVVVGGEVGQPVVVLAVLTDVVVEEGSDAEVVQIAGTVGFLEHLPELVA
jgi:hypothetical protein